MKATVTHKLTKGRNDLSGLVRTAGFNLPKGARIVATVSPSGDVSILAEQDNAKGETVSLEQRETGSKDPALKGWNVVRPIHALNDVLRPHGASAALVWDVDRKAVRADIRRDVSRY